MNIINFSKCGVASAIILFSVGASAQTLSLDTTNVEYVKHAGYEALVGQDGLALYTFKKDNALDGQSPKCTSEKDEMPLGSCLARWPAAIVSSSEVERMKKVDPNFGYVDNPELKAQQLTYNSLPLYYWFKDSKDRNFTGSGVLGAWSLVIKDKGATFFDGVIK